jgi:hypothetical protein
MKFVDVLVDHGRLPHGQNPYLVYIVLLETGRLEEHLRPLLSDENWNWLQIQMAQAKRVEPSLRKSGRWPVPVADDDEDAEQPPAVK